MPLLTKLSDRLVPAFLIIILIIAAGLRFYNINWDNGIFAHPDERSTVAFYAPTIRWPEDSADLLDPRASTLNPFWDTANQSRRSYTYGHFPLYSLVLVAHLLNDLAPWLASLPLTVPPVVIQFMQNNLSGQGFAQIGRALVALADLFSVYLVFLLGRRLYGPWAGLLAAALSTFTVLQIQLAHFFAVDPISTTFTLLALYGAILMYDRRSAGAAVLTGVGIGLAVASKFSALPVAFAPLVAGYLAARRDRRLNPGHLDSSKHPSSTPASPLSPGTSVPHPPSHISYPPSQIRNPQATTQNRMLGLALLALVVAFIIFAATSPFVLLDFENFKRAVLDEQGNMVSGVADMPFTRQYRHTLAYWYFIVQQLRWGMGWPLGLLAFGGLLWVVIKAVRGRAQAGEWIILWWIILYFGPTGLFLAKFMRYMVPLTPLFVLFGAGLVTALWRYRSEEYLAGSRPAHQPPVNEASLPSLAPAARPSRPPVLLRARWVRGTAVALASIALAGAAFWSLAFVNGVYGSEHPWVTFARWIYANVPDGSCIAWEHWDDRQPTDLPEPGGNAGAHHYLQPQLPMYDDDTPQKYEFLRDTLINCDYIVLASNRLWRTIPRLPERYPMSTRYYQALFSGELGFEQVYSVETPPRLGPFVFDDQAADESFTVYDHPKPILFKKKRQLTPAEWEAILGNTWQGAIPGYVGAPTLLMRLRGAGNVPTTTTQRLAAETGKSLMLKEPLDQLPVVDDFHWNTPANQSTLLAVLVWWFAVMLIGLIAFPVTYLLFNKLPDRGYGLSKSFGLLLAGYFVSLNSSLDWLSNRLITVIIALVILAGFSLWISSKERRQLIRFFRRQRWFILTGEVVFTLVYLFFVYLRILNPDLWQPWLGGEKMLEIGFLNAVVKSAHMPPYDPFFAGGIINYYYYGLFIVGILIKLTGIRPEIAFNLAVPTLAALTGVNVFSLASNLSAARLSYGLLGPQRDVNIENSASQTPTPKLVSSPPPPVAGQTLSEAEGLAISDPKLVSSSPPPVAGQTLSEAAGSAISDPKLVSSPSPSVAEQALSEAIGSKIQNPKSKIQNPQAIVAGLLAVLFVGFISNLEGAAQFLRELARLSTSDFQSAIPGFQTLVLAVGGLGHVVNGETLATYNYWDPTRVIPNTINEFPFFSFLFADLHPHMIGIPFTILFLSLAYNWLRSKPQPGAESANEQPQRAAMAGNDQVENDSNPAPASPLPLAVSLPIESWDEASPPHLRASPPPRFSTSASPRRLSSPPHFVASVLRRLLVSSSPGLFFRWLALPFILGALAVINTWDLPTYLGLMGAVFLVGCYRRSESDLSWPQVGLLLLSGVLFAGSLLAATYLLYAPFFANYHALEVGLGLVHTKTSLDQHLKIWGFFLFIIATWLWISLLYPATRHSLLRVISLFLRRWNVWPHLSEIYGRVVKRETDGYQLGLWSLALALFVAVILALLGYRVPAYLFPLVILALLLLFRREVTTETAYLGLLTFTGLLVLFGVEFFFLRDWLGGGDAYRMNTLFKFFIQVWVIFGLVAAVVLPHLWRWAWRWPLPLHLLWQTAVLLLLLASLIYPLFGTHTRVDDRFPGLANRPAIGTLDGLAYMTAGTFEFEWPYGSHLFKPVELKYDYEAIRWLQEHVSGTPIIAEAKVGYYREGGMRVAAYTGLPSVLGGLHQDEQRYAWQIGDRDFVVNEFWTTPDPARTLQLIDQLGIRFIYIGQLERVIYGDYVGDKFEQLRRQGALKLVFENEETKIYRRE